MMEEEAGEGASVQTCFICNERLYGDLEAVNLHIDNCLSNPNGANQEAEEEEVEEKDDGEYMDTDTVARRGGASSSNIPQQQQQQEEEEEGWDAYEWAGQLRVRATDMMEGGYRSAGFATSSKKRDEDNEDEEDLDVEDDGAAQFGESQYTERDIVVNMDDDTEDASALREMVSGGTMRIPTSER